MPSVRGAGGGGVRQWDEAIFLPTPTPQTRRSRKQWISMLTVGKKKLSFSEH